MERLIDAAVVIVAMVVPSLSSESFEKTLHAVSFPGWPAPHGLNEGNIAILLQLYDSLSLVARMLLASKTLPGLNGRLCP